MTIKEVIKNITEIQDPIWASNLSDDEVDYIEKNFWLVWQKLKLIDDMEIIEPLYKISKLFSFTNTNPGHLKSKNWNIKFENFYKICIELIPKMKYSFISIKRKKNRKDDIEFINLLARELNESVHNCRDYYDIYEKYGFLDKEKIRLFEKYGKEIVFQSTDKITIVNINSINVHPKRNKTDKKSKEYLIQLERIKSFGLLEPIIVQKKTNYIVSGHMRYRCCKEVGERRIPVIKKEFKFDIIDLINFKIDKGNLISERVNEYRRLNQETKKLGYKERKELMGGINMRDYLFKQTGISQTQNYRLEHIEKTNSEIYNRILKGDITVNQGHLELKKLIDSN